MIGSHWMTLPQQSSTAVNASTSAWNNMRLSPIANLKTLTPGWANIIQQAIDITTIHRIVVEENSRLKNSCMFNCCIITNSGNNNVGKKMNRKPGL